MKVDIFNHIFPTQYYEKMLEVAPNGKDMSKRVTNIPVIVDLDARFKMMDEFDDYVQVPCLPNPPIEVLARPEISPELSRVGNDGLAEYVEKYPDRFPGFIATLPMNSPEAAIEETDRCIKDLGARGIQMFSNVNGVALDHPDFKPLFARMAEYDLPIWIHPTRAANFPDYLSEKKSKYEIWWTLGWPYETSVAMSRIVFAGYFDEFPQLKIITHHMGAMIPYFEGRIGPGWDQLGSRTSDEDLTDLVKQLKKRPFDYFKMFYADTAVFGSVPATKCGLEFFTPDNVLFASDCPFDPEKGPGYIRETIKIINNLDVSEDDREKIFSGNARKLLKLK